MIVQMIEEQIEDFSDMVDEVSALIDEIGLQDNQINCQKLHDGPDDWTTGVGAVSELEEKNECKYHIIQKKLENSSIEKYIIKYQAYRTRIMILPPRKCYSVHKDLGYRIHIPIVTNHQNWMIWPEENTCVQLSTGNIYLTNTIKTHTFINGDSHINRIHIVMGVSTLLAVKMLAGKSVT